MLSFSVIIPTLNEADNIESLLVNLNQLDKKLELIVADSESSDNTVILSKKYAKVIQALKRGRGAQMNAGARVATGDILWFLHADCHPHADSIKIMRKALDNQRVVGGGFEYFLNQAGFHFRLAEELSNLKNRQLKWLFGDMGIFVRKHVFEQMKGYADIPLMEDMDFCKRLKKYGQIVFLPQRMKTSTRRWLEEGFVKNSLRSWLLQSAWALGASPYKLSKWYKFK